MLCSIQYISENCDLTPVWSRSLAKALGIKAPWANKQRNNWFSVVADADGTDVGCLWVMHPALVTALENTKLVAPASRATKRVRLD